MKKIFTYIIILMVISLTSCTYTLRTCQTVNVESPKVNLSNDRFIYEDSLVVIEYDFWASGGAVSFKIYNKTEAPIYVNWKNSNFIFNGYNNEYWSDNIVTETNSSKIFRTDGWGTSNSTTTINPTNPFIITDSKYSSVNTLIALDNSVTVTKRENPSIQIPPKSFNQIHKFDIMFPIWNVTDTTINYTEINTPVSFRNYLAISIDKNFETQTFIDNKFYVSSIHSFVEKNPKQPPQIKRITNGFYVIKKREYWISGEPL